MNQGVASGLPGADDFLNPHSGVTSLEGTTPGLGACRRIRSGFERPFFRLAASGCIDDKTDIACLAVFARRKYGSLWGGRLNSPTRSCLQFAQVLVNSGLY